MRYTKPEITANEVASKTIQAGTMKNGNNPDGTGGLSQPAYEADE